MTPKEKAKYLIWRYLPYINIRESEERIIVAKKLSTICVEVTIDSLRDSVCEVDQLDFIYWHQVQKEIDNYEG